MPFTMQALHGPGEPMPRECHVCNNDWVLDCAHFGELAVQLARTSNPAVSFMVVHGPGVPGGDHNWACHESTDADDCPTYVPEWGEEPLARAEFERRCEAMREAQP